MGKSGCSTCAPIIVSGPGRSGTTFTAALLQHHEDLRVLTQVPVLMDAWLLMWRECMDSARIHGRRKRYDCCGVRSYEVARDLWCDSLLRFLNDGKRVRKRWGVKWLWLVSNSEWTELLSIVWPNIRWVVCIRDPVATYESSCSTFVHQDKLPWSEFCRRWILAEQFARTQATFVVQMDKIDESQREATVRAMLDSLDLSRTKRVAQFVHKWPAIWRRDAVAPHRPEYTLSQSEIGSTPPRMIEAMERLGYSLSHAGGE